MGYVGTEFALPPEALIETVKPTVNCRDSGQNLIRNARLRQSDPSIARIDSRRNARQLAKRRKRLPYGVGTDQQERTEERDTKPTPISNKFIEDRCIQGVELGYSLHDSDRKSPSGHPCQNHRIVIGKLVLWLVRGTCFGKEQRQLWAIVRCRYDSSRFVPDNVSIRAAGAVVRFRERCWQHEFKLASIVNRQIPGNFSSLLQESPLVKMSVHTALLEVKPSIRNAAGHACRYHQPSNDAEETDIYLFRKQISDPSQRVDRDIRFQGFQSPPQTRHQGLDRVGHDLLIETVNRVVQQALGDYLTCATHQQFESVELAMRYGHNSPVDLDLPHVGVQRKIGNIDCRPRGAA